MGRNSAADETTSVVRFGLPLDTDIKLRDGVPWKKHGVWERLLLHFGPCLLPTQSLFSSRPRSLFQNRDKGPAVSDVPRTVVALSPVFLPLSAASLHHLFLDSSTHDVVARIVVSAPQS
jgi:hypothetical protein